MGIEWLDKKISCEYCGKEAKLTSVKYWLKLSEVTQDVEIGPVYFCSYTCLKAWISRVHESIAFALFEARMRDKLWLDEEKRMHCFDSEACVHCRKQ